jgi:hypothetical protein
VNRRVGGVGLDGQEWIGLESIVDWRLGVDSAWCTVDWIGSGSDLGSWEWIELHFGLIGLEWSGLESIGLEFWVWIGSDLSGSAGS